MLANIHWRLGIRMYIPREAGSMNYYPTSISGNQPVTNLTGPGQMSGNQHSSSFVVPGRSRNIVLPWNVVRAWFTDTLQWLRRRPGVFPEIKMFQDTPDDKRLLYERDDLHLSSALRTLQGINIPNFLQKHSPHLSPAAGVFDSP